MEVGPGSGVYLPALSKSAREVVGADIEHAYLSRLRPLEQRNPKLRLVLDDIARSSFADGFFDMILCSEVIEHVKASERAFAEMYRLLSPGGVLILSTPQRFSPLEVCSKIAFLPGIIDIVRWIYNEPIHETGHVNLMTRRTLFAALSAAGFAIREVHTGGGLLPGDRRNLGRVRAAYGTCGRT